MSSSNRILSEITPEQAATIAAAFEQLKTALALVLLINLTAEERTTIRKMGDRKLAFVSKTLEYARQNPTYV